MAQAEHCQDVETVTTDGFDGLFQGGSTPEPGQNQGGSTPEPGLTLKEAVEFYKISEKSVRIRIGQGKIPAIKVAGSNGPEWRIYPDGLPTVEPDRNQGPSSPEPERNQPGTSPEVEITPEDLESQEVEEVEVSGGYQESRASELEQLLDVVKEQASKLEAANYRIGYLESQTEGYRDQIKLLTDSQHQKKGWLLSFWAWFTGNRGV